MPYIRILLTCLLVVSLLQACGRDNNHADNSSQGPGREPNPPGFTLASAGLIGEETVELAGKQWRTFCLTTGAEAECQLGTVTVQGDIITLQPSGKGRFGIYRVEPVAGHFEFKAKTANGIPVADDYDSPTALALIPAAEDNAPLLNTYTALFFERNLNTAAYTVRDRQPAVNSLCRRVAQRYQNDLRDNSCAVTASEKTAMYSAKLDGRFGFGINGRNNYSIPFTQTSGHMRIMHDSIAGVFRYYYGITANILGEAPTTAGEMELAISHAWRDDDSDKYLAAVLTGPGDHEPAIIQDVVIKNLPTVDSGSNAGFSLEQRDFTWSGFTDHAVVISFDANLLPPSYQLVFWTLANNVPMYRLSDQLLFSYEFVELWALDRMLHPGAFEPMSDDLRWRNTVEVIEDNAVRKVIYWRYPLVNPAYHTISDNINTVPMGEEWWTVYPDGTAYRRTVYTPDPNAASELPDEFEFSEFLLIAGTQSDPVDHAVSGASLNLYSLAGDTLSFRPAQSSNTGSSSADAWPEVIAAASLRSAPGSAIPGATVYAAYANPSTHPLISQSAALHYDVSWHDYRHQFSHWPVAKTPFEYHDKSFARWTEEVSHSSLISVQVAGGGRDPAIKEWTTLVGVESTDIPERLRERAGAWLYPPPISGLSGCTYNGYDATMGALILTFSSDTCSFQWGPELNGRKLVNPSIVINNFSGNPVDIAIDNITLTTPELSTATVNDSLLIWIKRDLTQPSSFSISLE